MCCYMSRLTDRIAISLSKVVGKKRLRLFPHPDSQSQCRFQLWLITRHKPLTPAYYFVGSPASLPTAKKSSGDALTSMPAAMSTVRDPRVFGPSAVGSRPSLKRREPKALDLLAFTPRKSASDRQPDRHATKRSDLMLWIVRSRPTSVENGVLRLPDKTASLNWGSN